MKNISLITFAIGFLCGSSIIYYLFQQISYANKNTYEDTNENEKDNDNESENNDGLQYYIYEKYM